MRFWACIRWMILTVVLCAAACSRAADDAPRQPGAASPVEGQSPADSGDAGKPRGRSDHEELVHKSDREWRKILSSRQYRVTREKATEEPGSGKYCHSKQPGTYHCVCCGAPLFESTTKFESGTGWPSFWKPADKKHIKTAVDFSTPELRVEVMCARCDAHLGHVFSDGPPPTGLRFCINSTALDLVAKGQQPRIGRKAETSRIKPKKPRRSKAAQDSENNAEIESPQSEQPGRSG